MNAVRVRRKKWLAGCCVCVWVCVGLFLLLVAEMTLITAIRKIIQRESGEGELTSPSSKIKKKSN